MINEPLFYVYTWIVLCYFFGLLCRKRFAMTNKAFFGCELFRCAYNNWIASLVMTKRRVSMYRFAVLLLVTAKEGIIFIHIQKCQNMIWIASCFANSQSQ
jgi:hypothetical protein